MRRRIYYMRRRIYYITSASVMGAAGAAETARAEALTWLGSGSGSGLGLRLGLGLGLESRGSHHARGCGLALERGLA